MADTDSPSLSTTFQDIDGNFSSKRVLAFVFAALLIVMCLVDTFTTHKVAEFWANNMMYLVASCAGLACAERFAPKA